MILAAEPFAHLLAHLSLMLLLCEKCSVEGALRCCMALMLFQLTLSMAGYISQQSAALQRLHLICLLPQLCTTDTRCQSDSTQVMYVCSLTASRVRAGGLKTSMMTRNQMLLCFTSLGLTLSCLLKLFCSLQFSLSSILPV